jgi:hypothetical protein
VLLLIDSGADVNVAGESGYPPLHWAGAMGDESLASRILEAGADPDALSPRYRVTPVGQVLQVIEDGREQLPPGVETERLLLAEAQRRIPVLVRLITSGAELLPALEEIINWGATWALDGLVGGGIDLRPTLAAHGPALLRRALVEEEETVLNRLLSLGADINQLGADGEPTLMHFLADRDASRLAMLQLIDAGARVSPSTPARFSGEYRELLERAVISKTR